MQIYDKRGIVTVERVYGGKEHGALRACNRGLDSVGRGREDFLEEVTIHLRSKGQAGVK